MTIGLGVPVLKNFKGFTELMFSVDKPVLPLVYPNWIDNVGVAPAWNEIIDLAAMRGIEHLIMVNDDVKFRAGVIESLVSVLDAGIDVVSPTNETGVAHPYGLNFWCFAIKPQEFLQKFGEFDENFAPAYYEDDDMAYRIKLLGGSIVTLPVYAYHAVRGSDMGQDWVNEAYEKNQKYYVEKWGGMPTHETFTKPYNEDCMDPTRWRNDAR